MSSVQVEVTQGTKWDGKNVPGGGGEQGPQEHHTVDSPTVSRKMVGYLLRRSSARKSVQVSVCTQLRPYRFRVNSFVRNDGSAAIEEASSLVDWRIEPQQAGLLHPP